MCLYYVAKTTKAKDYPQVLTEYPAVLGWQHLGIETTAIQGVIPSPDSLPFSKRRELL
jgi:hypothetical protein